MNIRTSADALHFQLLRPSILHILRAAGYQSTRPQVLDALVDLAVRYLLKLATATQKFSANNHNNLGIAIEDVRMAMEEIGALLPTLTTSNEAAYNEDARGIQAFLDWCKGDGNREIRRMAGMAKEGAQVEVGGLGAADDFLTTLKKKNAGGKADDLDARFQGTVLGENAEPKFIKIEGSGPIDHVHEWTEFVLKSGRGPSAERRFSSASALSSPPEDMEMQD